ncbi:MAG: TlpA family protein disulfide reductase [Elusimicrobia bacterium]|nr:TlpA family protein disulfide reductase [Elusimicrobiota bacterium]
MKKFISAACFIIGSGALLGGCKKESTKTTQSPIETQSVEMAQNLALPMAASSNQWELAPRLGKRPVLLVFFTTWCPYCNQSMPHLQGFYERNRAKNLEVVGIDLQEPRDLVEGFVKKYGLTFPVLLAEDQRLLRPGYPVRFLPTLYFINREGALVKKYEGFHPTALDEIATQL